MSYVKIRRCHITCRIESTQTMNDIVSHGKFISANEREVPIHRMLAAYNVETKEARIYAEFDRIDEKLVEEHLHNMGAGSVIIDTFSKEDWESASEIAMNSVLECSSKPGFSLFRQGNEPSAKSRPGNMGGSRHMPDGTESQDSSTQLPFTGKRTATHDNNREKECSSSSEKRPHREQYTPSAYDLPESVPSYVLQFTSFNMRETMTAAISTMQTSSMSIVHNERQRAEEAESRCKKLEKVIKELDQSKVTSMNKTVHAYANVCCWISS